MPLMLFLDAHFLNQSVLFLFVHHHGWRIWLKVILMILTQKAYLLNYP